MEAPLDERYFIWLYSQVGSVKLKNRAKTHWNLLSQLHKKEFVWVVPNDDNREEDGKCLRHEFLDETEAKLVDQEWLDQSCSMLEMLIALSRRLAFEDDGSCADWFWHLIQVLELNRYTDGHFSETDAAVIDGVLDRVIWRRYRPNGHGGLFPLRRPEQDQRDVEIWYQLSAYLLENL